MSHHHTNRWKPSLFRAYVTNKYYENRDEYHSIGQEHPYTFEQYVSNNINDLRKSFRKHKKGVDSVARLVLYYKHSKRFGGQTNVQTSILRQDR
jgi:hypothetical protein